MPYSEELKTSVRTIDGILKDSTDKDTIVTTLLCLCRILFKNHDMTSFVETEHRQSFKETTDALRERSAPLAPEINQAL